MAAVSSFSARVSLLAATGTSINVAAEGAEKSFASEDEELLKLTEHQEPIFYIGSDSPIHPEPRCASELGISQLTLAMRSLSCTTTRPTALRARAPLIASRAPEVPEERRSEPLTKTEIKTVSLFCGLHPTTEAACARIFKLKTTSEISVGVDRTQAMAAGTTVPFSLAPLTVTHKISACASSAEPQTLPEISLALDLTSAMVTQAKATCDASVAATHGAAASLEVSMLPTLFMAPIASRVERIARLRFTLPSFDPAVPSFPMHYRARKERPVTQRRRLNDFNGHSHTYAEPHESIIPTIRDDGKDRLLIPGGTEVTLMPSKEISEKYTDFPIAPETRLPMSYGKRKRVPFLAL
jgi:hypothetical protein